MKEQIIQYIEQNRNTYTREAITSQLVSAGYKPEDVEAAWQSLGQPDGEVIPVPPRGYAGATGLSGGSWDPGPVEQARPQSLMSSPPFWGYMVGFILLSYGLPGALFWLGASQSDGLIVNIGLGVFFLLQLIALVVGLVSLGGNRPRGAGLLAGVLMVLVVIPTIAAALFFGYCLIAIGGFGTP